MSEDPLLEERYISISDMQTFLSCRERWNYSSGLRQSLRHKSSPRLYLNEGTAFHLGLDAAVQGDDPIEAVKEYQNAERIRLTDEYVKVVKSKPWGIELKDFDESCTFAVNLTNQYFQHYGRENPLADQGLRYLATEISFKIPLPSMGSGHSGYFCGTFDGIAVDSEGRIFLVENKTYRAKPDIEELRFHFQTTGYAVAFKKLTGMNVTGSLYNGVAKRLIVQPKLLKSGKLSTDKRQSVTVESYRIAIEENGLDATDYVEMLDFLHERERQGDDRFFFREKFYFNETQMNDWESEFRLIVAEMLSDPVIYRTVPFNGCGKTGSDCWYRDLCHTKHSGGNVDLVLERYQVGLYGTTEAISSNIEPTVVSSIDELLEFLQGAK